mmetsp:Transcript_18777/g.37962  ORF Transcript_18777/g.37962 Transcript_18777/m.37962 type:complete len:111 (-) Transcript_18777:139-471(-)|eukprot:CAMPEP_0167785544 /NCGR_PEP_ID=MMETSP0111_2-20121227/8291_1 /TAXON_ID=91324 /ORGANISM="Lotharella globosa, Strain CCCM811" /LENGTH=110 /DNA_ID=CAMNT_0007676817 /DNA_START=56 /DNA_END=388 /DNA_ORIENTATION=+
MYTSVQKGKLSFKGSGKKKKKKKRKKETKEAEEATSVIEKKQKQDDGKDSIKEPEGMTESEKNFLRAKARREALLIEKNIKKTHREKIKEFNEYLGSLTEHNDIPRVGPG